MVTDVTFPKYHIGMPISAMIDGRICFGQIAVQVSIDPPVYQLHLDDGRDLECSLFQFAPIIGNESEHGRGPGRVLLPLMSQVMRKSDGVRGLVSGYCYDYQGPDQTLIKEYAVWFAAEAAQGPRIARTAQAHHTRGNRWHKKA